MKSVNRMTGGSIFLSLLKDEGVTHLFGNPGTTELPVMDALNDHPDLPYVLGLQESVVVAMADGFSRASGELVACNVHVAPGLGNAMGALYNAKFTRTPMILTAGQHELGHGLTEPRLYDPLVPIAEPLVKWAVEATRLEDLPRIVRRAAKVAMAPPQGPVFLSLPGDILTQEAGIDLGSRTRVDARSRPSDEALSELADRLLAAERPAIMCGDELVKCDGLQEAAELAGVLGAPAYQQTVPFGSHFLSEHPCYMGTMERSQPKTRELLETFDLLMVVGCDLLRSSVNSDTDPVPPGLQIVHVGLDTWEMGKNWHADMALLADPKETMKALVAMLRDKGGSALEKKARERIAELEKTNWTAKRAKLVKQLEGAPAEGAIHPDWLMYQLSEALPKNAIVVDEGLTSTRALQKLIPYRDRYSFHGLASGGIGWGIAAAVGIQLAQPQRPVCAVIGDGSAMYSIQALWTAAHLNLPVTFVITNNNGYRILKQRLMSFHGNDDPIGMDLIDPPLDFVALAKGMGVEGVRVGSPRDVPGALRDAIGAAGPRLVEVQVGDGGGVA